MKLIKVHGSSKYGMVSNSDYNRVITHRWTAGKTKWAAYPRAQIDGKNMYLHHLIIGNPGGDLQVDHKDGNVLNARRNNLRFCTSQQNAFNRGKTYNEGVSTSRYKGVKWDTRSCTWVARVTKNGERVHYTNHETEIEAAKRYNKEATKHFGDFARLNVF